MNKICISLLTFIFLITIQSVSAQNDLLDELDKEFLDVTRYTRATFKANRILFGHSVETRKKGVLEFNVNTKFWNTPNSQTQDFGADRTTARFGVEYAFSDRFTSGFGVGTFGGIFNGYGKYRLIRQKDSDNKAPIAVTLLQSISYQTRSFNHIDLQNSISDRLSFATQAIFAHKFDSNFSLQIAPTFVRRNSDQFQGEPANHFALGFGTRFKIANHVSLVSEYYYVANPVEDEKLTFFGPFAIGANWDIKNVIVQFALTNTRNFDESTNITNTFNNFNFNDGNLHIGVSLTYALHLKKRKIN